MAATLAGTALTGGHRAAQAQVAARTAAEALALWRLLDLDNIDAAVGPWLTASTLSVTAKHAESTTIGAAYYRSFAQAETGRFRELPTIGSPLDRDRLALNLTLAGPVRFKALVGAGHPAAHASRTAAVGAVGTAWRFALDGGRDEVIDQVNRDPQALGWARIGGANPCAFCATLISRGPAYKSQGSASFQPHDACGCSAQPVFSREGAWTDQALDLRAKWDQAQREAREAGELYRGTKRDDVNAFRRFLARQN